MTGDTPAPEPLSRASRVVRVAATDRESLLPLRELLAWRDLLLLLTRRHIVVRYRQTILGFVWAILPPVLYMVVFSVIFGGLAGLGSEDVPYPVFSYLGLLPWGYFASVVGSTSGCLAANASLITQAYFPRLLLPVAAALARLVDLAIAMVVLLVLCAVYDVSIAPTALLLPVFVLIAAVFALGIGMALAAINVRWRDVGHAVPLALQVAMYATPVAYSLHAVAPRWRTWIELNPMTAVVEGTRSAVLGRAIPWGSLGGAAVVACVALFVGAWLFSRAERTFADWV